VMNLYDGWPAVLEHSFLLNTPCVFSTVWAGKLALWLGGVRCWACCSQMSCPMKGTLES
jgi:hypothetical protein